MRELIKSAHCAESLANARGGQSHYNATAGMTVHIRNSAIRAPIVPVQDVNQASALYRAFIAHNDFGARDAGECLLKVGTRTVGRVSYNGRVWDMNDKEVILCAC